MTNVEFQQNYRTDVLRIEKIYFIFVIFIIILVKRKKRRYLIRDLNASMTEMLFSLWNETIVRRTYKESKSFWNSKKKQKKNKSWHKHFRVCGGITAISISLWIVSNEKVGKFQNHFIEFNVLILSCDIFISHFAKTSALWFYIIIKFMSHFQND